MGKKCIGDVGNGFHHKNIRVSLHFENFSFLSSFFTTEAKPRTCLHQSASNNMQQKREQNTNPDYRKVVFDFPVVFNYHSHKKPSTEEVLSEEAILCFHII